ncbi:hypothetical protein, partial [Listeria fleischmannii]|jgi:hypothetical protein|uniref:Uncharacterized protein n=1 Tax=Listeria fleischmannii TaxID=1069827 RepID=A0A841YDP6_9LIST
MKLKKFIVATLATALCFTTITPVLTENQEAQAAKPGYWAAPNPTGAWKYQETKKYKAPNTTSAKQFGIGVAAYFAGSLKNTSVAAISSGIASVFAGKIKNKQIYVTAKCYKKENAYVRLNKVDYTFYKDSKRTKKIKSISVQSKFIKKYKYVYKK